MLGICLHLLYYFFVAILSNQVSNHCLQALLQGPLGPSMIPWPSRTLMIWSVCSTAGIAWLCEVITDHSRYVSAVLWHLILLVKMKIIMLEQNQWCSTILNYPWAVAMIDRSIGVYKFRRSFSHSARVYHWMLLAWRGVGPTDGRTPLLWLPHVDTRAWWRSLGNALVLILTGVINLVKHYSGWLLSMGMRWWYNNPSSRTLY